MVRTRRESRLASVMRIPARRRTGDMDTSAGDRHRTAFYQGLRVFGKSGLGEEAAGAAPFRLEPLTGERDRLTDQLEPKAVQCALQPPRVQTCCMANSARALPSVQAECPHRRTPLLTVFHRIVQHVRRGEHYLEEAPETIEDGLRA